MDVRTYFDRMAEHWDDEVTPIDEARRTIVFLSEIGEQTHILDVACGTGAMFEAYEEKRPKHVTAIDLSEKMAESLLHEEADIRKVNSGLPIWYQLFPDF